MKLTFIATKTGFEIARGVDDHGEPNGILVLAAKPCAFTVHYLGKRVGYLNMREDKDCYTFSELPNMTLHTLQPRAAESVEQLLEYLENRK